MKYPLQLLCVVVCLLYTSTISAEVVIRIQPSADLLNIVWTVSWDSLEGNEFPPRGRYRWDSMDPNTGATSQNAPWGRARHIGFSNIGNPFTETYDSDEVRGFGDGIDGVVSTESGWGVSPDDDDESTGDDFYIFNTQLNLTEPFPSSGSFRLLIPGANLGNYNIGSFTNNSNVTISVSSTPAPALVPEPSTYALLSLATLAGISFYKRRKV